MTIDLKRIMELLPHRPPMLLIDSITDVVPHESATGVKTVTDKEFWCVGHFPGRPIMPGVLIVEAMAQTAGALVVHSTGPELEGKLVYFMAIEGAKFRKPVVPGDVLHIHVRKEQARRTVWKFFGEAKVNGELCAEATVTAMVMPGVGENP
jgi:3-hydroxyacyl-[acyl-carrier-protein] dehydratase